MREKDLEFYEFILKSKTAPIHIQQQVYKTKDPTLLESLLSLTNLDENILKDLKKSKDQIMFKNLLQLKLVTSEEINDYILGTDLTNYGLLILLVAQKNLSFEAYEKLTKLSAPHPIITTSLLESSTYPERLHSLLSEILAAHETPIPVSKEVLTRKKEIFFEGLEKDFTPAFLKLMVYNFKAHEFKNLPGLFEKVLTNLVEAETDSSWHFPSEGILSRFFELILEPFEENSTKYYSLKEYEELQKIYELKANKELLQKYSKVIKRSLNSNFNGSRKVLDELIKIFSFEDQINAFNESILDENQLELTFDKASLEEKFNLLFHPLLNDSDFIDLSEDVIDQISSKEFTYLMLKSNDYRVAFIASIYLVRTRFENLLESHKNAQSVLGHVCNFFNQGQVRLSEYIFMSSFLNKEHLLSLHINDFKKWTGPGKASEIFSQLLEENLVTSEHWEIFQNLFCDSELTLEEALETAATI